MPKTISFHNGTTWSRGHNIRDERYTSKQKHIDTSLTVNNVTICDIPVRQAYEEIFGQAVQEYNDRQKRADRKIDCYYDKIKKDKRKHPVYECIVQIGDKDDTGNSAELEKQALIRFAEEWKQRNPNLYLIGAYIHADEPNGTVHLHCDYIPVAECSRGMKIQNSYDKALQQQGFKSENIHQTAQIAWQEREREALTAICRELFIDAQHSQGIGKGREYLTPQEYQRTKDRMKEQIETELQPLRDEFQEYAEMQTSIRDVQLDQKKIPFSKRVSVNAAELNTLTRQARAYTANKQAIITLKQDQQDVEQGKQELVQGREQLEIDRATFEEERKKALAVIAEEREKIDTAKIVLNHDEYIKKLLCRIQYLEDEIKILNNRNNDLKLNLDLERSAVSRVDRTFRSTVSEKNERIKSLERQLQQSDENLSKVYQVLINVVKAVGMLKYDKGKYKISGLSEEQGRLIDAIANYGAYRAEQDSFMDFSKIMQEKIGISEDMQDFIDKLAPKKNRGRGGMKR